MAEQPSTGRRSAPTDRFRRALDGLTPAVRVALIGLVILATLGGVWITKREDAASRPGWNVVWQDEFEGDSLDYFKWNAQDLASPRNNEVQYYTPNHVRVADGQLRIISDAIPFGGRSHTSGAVDSYGKFSFTYGRVEIRATLPRMGQGVWPALWLLGNGCNPLGSPCPWPTHGSTEIDIMEAVNTPTRLYTDLHFGTTPGQSMSPGRVERAGVNLADEAHTFAMEWEPGGVIRWYLDDEQIADRTVPGYFEGPMYLFLNTAIGGNWAGPPSAGTPFPQRFEIDYVRVYQRG